jgi:hypothetical protein
MMDFIISAAAFIAKGTAIMVMLASCVAVYFIGVDNTDDSAQ